MELKTIIVLLVSLVVLVTLFDVIETGNPVTNLDVLDGVQEWEKYILDEEANKDKLYCRTTKINGDIIKTRWYNSFINPNEVVRTDNGDTRTENCEWPNYEPIYATGSNEGKIYSRKVSDGEGNIIETVWHNACSDEVERIDEGDTTYLGSNEFKGECYHPDYATVNGETIDEEIEEEVKDTPVVTLWNNIVSVFKNLFNM